MLIPYGNDILDLSMSLLQHIHEERERQVSKIMTNKNISRMKALEILVKQSFMLRSNNIIYSKSHQSIFQFTVE